MISEVQLIKIDRRFDAFDADADGFLELADYQDLARRVLDVFTISHDTQLAKTVLGGFEKLWFTHVSNLDIDGDRKISRSEFRQGVSHSIIDAGSLTHVVTPLAQALFAVAAGEGKKTAMDLPTYRRLMEAFRLNEAAIVSAFERIDTDNDGYISHSEYAQAWSDFYLADDPSTPGSWLFGEPR